MRDTDCSGVEREHVKTISASWKYADSILSLDGGGDSSSAGGRRALAGTRAKNATKNGTNNDKDTDRDTKLDPVADRFLLWLLWSDITSG